MSSTTRPRLTVSVVIPTYNRADYLRDAIDSALNQSRLPDEIVIVDDGSTDDTDRVLAAYGSQVRVIRQHNQGRSAARNTGLRHAQGDLIVFLDSDDTLTRESIAQRAAIFECRPNIGVVYGDMLVIDAAGNTVGVTTDFMTGPRPVGNIFGDLAVRCFILMPAMIRRSVLGTLSFDETLHESEDYDLWRRLAAICEFDYVSEPVASYRIHDTNTIVTQPRKLLESSLIVQRRFFSMPEFHGLSRRQRGEIYCTHGAKCSALGYSRDARRYLARAVANWPFSLQNCGLFAISLVSPRLLENVIVRRRQAQKAITAPAVITNTTTTEEAESRELAAAGQGAGVS